MVAVYWVLPARLIAGVNLAVAPLMLTVPLTIAPPEVVASVKVAVVSEEFVIASEKLADIEEFNAMPVAAFAGIVADTIGGVVSGATPVVKFQLKSALSALPLESCTPVVIVAMYSVPAARTTDGVNVAELLLAVTVPAMAKPARDEILKVVGLSVVLSIASEKVTVIAELTATAFAALAGEVEDTVGGIVSVPDVVAITAFDWPETFPALSRASTV
jgi:hypothetical protein